jgi:hypothetical protein
MPTGPKGEKRPADVNVRAVMIAKIATGEVEDAKRDPAKALHREGGLKRPPIGGAAALGRGHGADDTSDGSDAARKPAGWRKPTRRRSSAIMAPRPIREARQRSP